MWTSPHTVLRGDEEVQVEEAMSGMLWSPVTNSGGQLLSYHISNGNRHSFQTVGGSTFQEGGHGHGLTPICQDYAATAAVMFDRQHMSHSHHREAPIKSTLSFQNLEAALPRGMPAGEPIGAL